MKTSKKELIAYGNLMRHAYLLQNEEEIRQCPRAKVSAILVDSNLKQVATGRNIVHMQFAPCSCNDETDTISIGSQTCKAVHAEVSAIDRATAKLTLHTAKILITTRPPCSRCLKVIKERTEVHTIITTNQYPDRDNSENVWRENRERTPRHWLTLDYNTL